MYVSSNSCSSSSHSILSFNSFKCCESHSFLAAFSCAWKRKEVNCHVGFLIMLLAIQMWHPWKDWIRGHVREWKHSPVWVLYRYFCGCKMGKTWTLVMSLEWIYLLWSSINNSQQSRQIQEMTIHATVVTCWQTWLFYIALYLYLQILEGHLSLFIHMFPVA